MPLILSHHVDSLLYGTVKGVTKAGTERGKGQASFMVRPELIAPQSKQRPMQKCDELKKSLAKKNFFLRQKKKSFLFDIGSSSYL